MAGRSVWVNWRPWLIDFPASAHLEPIENFNFRGGGVQKIEIWGAEFQFWLKMRGRIAILSVSTRLIGLLGAWGGPIDQNGVNWRARGGGLG